MRLPSTALVVSLLAAPVFGDTAPASLTLADALARARDGSPTRAAALARLDAARTSARLTPPLPSGASRLGSPNEYVDYAASKGALDAMTIELSKEAATEGIRVNAVRPGFIYTDIHASGGEPGRVDRVNAFVPMARGGHADEVARAILTVSPSSQRKYAFPASACKLAPCGPASLPSFSFQPSCRQRCTRPTRSRRDGSI